MSDQKNKKPMTASDYIKNQPHLQGKPLSLPPTSSPLADFPPLSYSKAAATPTTSSPSTIAIIKGGSSSPATQPPTKATYFQKPHKQHLITTSYTKTVSLRELNQYTNKIFYEDSLYPTDNLTKNRTFYEYILVDSKSAEITHYPDRNNPNQIAYSTCKILKVATIELLGFLNHHTQKYFSTPGYHIPGYTYVDYINAFFRTFYLRPYDHSWFISFDTKCNKNIPGWFAEWWVWFGPSEEIYPETVIKTSFPFYLKHQHQVNNDVLSKIYFHIDMGIPWICSWHFNIAPYFNNTPFSLLREFRIKWWDKYDLNRCSLTQIQRYFSSMQQIQQTVRTVSKNTPLVPQQTAPAKDISYYKNLVQQHGKDPKASTSTNSPAQQQSSKATTSTTSASPSSSTKKAKKTVNQEKLQHIFAELQKQLLGEEDNEDDDMQEPDDAGTQQNPLDLDEDPFGGPLAQDPFA